MPPRSTGVRVVRIAWPGQRAQSEIQRDRTPLRSVVDLERRERTILLVRRDPGGRRDPDRGDYRFFIAPLKRCSTCRSGSRKIPLHDYLAAVSVGIIDGPLLDLSFAEDSAAAVDMNVVITGAGELVEIQGTAEHGTFNRDQLDQLLDLAGEGVKYLIQRQKEALGAAASLLPASPE